METTLTMVLVEESIAHFSHIGDSRLYLYRDGKLRRLTRDHTVVQKEIDAGRLTPELAKLGSISRFTHAIDRSTRRY